MNATPYPLPRQTRESSILVGNGTTGPYGPTTFKIFDVEDIEIWAKASGAAFYSEVNPNDYTVNKTAALAFDTVSVTFDNNVPNTTSFIIQARRTAERSIAVSKAGAINALQLEKELSKQASAQSELRRDFDRSVQTDPGATPIKIKGGTTGQVPAFDANGNLVPVAPSASSVASVGLPAVVNVGDYLRRNAANDAYEPVAKAVVRADLAVAPYVATRTALKALDTTKDTRAIFDGSVWEFSAFNFTSLHALDTGEGVYIKADAVASATGGWTRKHDGVLNGLWFTGVLGDSINDDAAGITRALRLNTLFKIRFPAGTYLCGSAVTRDGGHVNIEGDGQYATIFKFTADTDGFSLGQSTAVIHCHMSDIGVITTQAAPTRAAVRLTMDITVGVQKNPGCIFERMEVKGDVITADWWGTGIKVTNPALPIYRDLQFFGRGGGTSAQIAAATDYAIQIESTILDIIPVFDNVFVLEYDTGVYLHSAGTVGIEGVYIANCNMVLCNYGVHALSDANGGYKPAQINIVNNHIQARIQGVKIVEYLHVNVSDNFISSAHDADITTHLVYLQACVYGHVSHNVLQALPVQTATKGVEVFGCANIDVSDNVAETPGVGVEFTNITFECYERDTIQNGTGAAFANTNGIATNRRRALRQNVHGVPNGSVLATNTTYYFASGASGTENVASGVMPQAGTARELRVSQTVAPGGAQTTVYTLMKNGVATALTCTVSASGLVASDNTHEVDFAAGDTWSIRAANSATAAGTIPRGAFAFYPTV